MLQELKKRIAEAMKSGDTVARDVLRLALGEIQTAEARKNGPVGDEDIAASIRKLIKSNEETLALSEGERAVVLRRENEILSSLLPKQLSVEAIVAALAADHDAIKAAKNDGQATGIAMKRLKASGASVSGNDVAAAVKQLRS